MTTDGYLDQSGGHKGLPFGKRRFEQLLLNHADKSFEEQFERLKLALHSYQGEHDQTDDITVVGFRI